MKVLTTEQKATLKIINNLQVCGTKKSFLKILNEHPIKNFNTIVPIKEKSKNKEEYRNTTLLKEAFFEFYFAQIQENKTKINSCASIIKYIIEKGGTVDVLLKEKQKNLSLASLWTSIISTRHYLLRPNISNKLTKAHLLLLKNLEQDSNQLNPENFLKELEKNKENKNISNDYLLYELYGYANKNNLTEITNVFFKHLNTTLDKAVEKIQNISLDIKENEKHFISNIRDKTLPNNALAYIKRTNKTHNFSLLVNTVKNIPEIKELIVDNTLKRIQLSQISVDQQRKVYGGDISKPNNTALFIKLNNFLQNNDMTYEQRNIFLKSVTIEKTQNTNTAKETLMKIENSALKTEFSNPRKKSRLKKTL